MKSECSGFVHSIKVPRLYKAAAQIAKKVINDGESLKKNIYNCQHKNLKGTYALVVETIKHSKALENLIIQLDLFKKEPRLDPWLARILITELVFRKRPLSGESKPVKTILSYQSNFDKLLETVANETEIRKAPKPRYVRVNTLFLTCDEAIKFFREEEWQFLQPPKDYASFLEIISNLNEYSFLKDFHIKDLLVFPANTEFHQHELYKNGSILLQDKTSCLPAMLLQPEPTSTVLDMCSAPGLKTTHLSAIMRNKGQIYASERKEDRFKVLQGLINGSGCRNVETLHLDALLLNPTDYAWCKDVEYILVDPSCSGSGMSDRINIFAEEKYEESRLRKLSAFQFKLLFHALTQFPKVKRVVYSTCSVQTQENEQVVHDVLNKVNNPFFVDSLKVQENEKKKKKKKKKSKEKEKESFDIANRPRFKLVEAMKDTWPRRGSDQFENGPCCLFADPEKDLTNGFFVAVIERVEDNTESLEVTSEVQPEFDLEVPEKEEKRKKRKMEMDSETETITAKQEVAPVEITGNREGIDELSPKKKKKKKKHKERSKEDETRETNDE